jgi:alkaline phosphatase
MTYVQRRFVVLGVLLLAAAALAGARNVILMIGDGMGPDMVTATGAYRYGPAYHRFGGDKRLALETLAHHRYVTTFADGGKYDFTWWNGNRQYPMTGATDSAAAGTALACGIKTYNAAIGVDMQKRPVRNIVEIARDRGLKTGIVTSVPISHATPAAFAAHNAHRNNYQEITHDMLFRTRPDVVMGAGAPEGTDAKAFTYIAQDDWQALTAPTSPYRLVRSRDEFRAVSRGEITGKILGLPFAHHCLKYRLADGSGADPATPTLAEMTHAALTALRHPQGFFLMVEGGAIDWCNHANDLNGAVGETLDFDDAVQVVLKWIAAHGGWAENLLLVTADHETGYLHSVQPTAAGTLPKVSWGTDGKWPNHTNRLVDVYYQGAGSVALTAATRTASDFEHGAIAYVDNTDLFRAMDAALRAATVKPQPALIGR